ncbi:hypothetical protein PF002_g13365 [Phytophthora fragariae]|uniref:Uncharacterized protein n=1 Tax=Phytophthora fragariae TaxID=53985 RepID=A0A6A3EYA2_9STRA|nr:hypothetical protein PF009_g11634 [Phytophthora fragariae]KAE9224952.1 hypothetical protein PF004_g12061 [Phytophthora fragariae]KAE9229204.1 hypothetical protein PF002_g13365 [Phytophthora fragariae]KAE9305263.1 hypothetical protein PF001_g12671 [Phytophthora fragariae]
MALSAKETKKRKCDGGQVAPGSHKRKKLEAGSASASAEKTTTQGKGATTSPTGKTVRETGAGKATTSKVVGKTGAGKATTGKTVSKTGACKAMNQDASGEIQEMEMVQSLVEQQAATIASEQPLSIEDVEQACDALVNITVELNEQARVQELERATLAEEKKQHAETVEEDKVAHQAWMRDRDAALSGLLGLQRENAKIGIYSKTVTEWISKYRNVEREKKDAQNGFN